MKIVFLGTPPFVQVIKKALTKQFVLVDSVHEADLGVVAAYGRILTKQELNTPKYGFLNIHPSLLPKYRGPSPIQQAILNGDTISGITVIKMDEQIDHGPIVYQEEVALADKDTFQTLSKKMFHRAAEILPNIIQKYAAGKITPQRQNDPMGSFCPKLTRTSGYFKIDNPPPSNQLDRMIRAYYPWPGVWTRWSPSRHPDPALPEKDLKIVKFLPNGLLQMEGKKAIPFKDFLNGYPEFPIKELQTEAR